ncbi:hypothetical protein ACBJ59_20945 [Nonomuraea sp. MTCD27]|uniref:hypothetical protein n=1 Tax=Nonomuraea sp. MTCD27 TaxID=1676747 RepID=UPI0035BF0C1D
MRPRRRAESRPGDLATGWGAALRGPAVSAVLRGIHRHPAHPWTVRSPADRAGLSPADRAGLSRAAFAQRFAGKVDTPPPA